MLRGEKEPDVPELMPARDRESVSTQDATPIAVPDLRFAQKQGDRAGSRTAPPSLGVLASRGDCARRP